jgi:hypothetical protein
MLELVGYHIDDQKLYRPFTPFLSEVSGFLGIGNSINRVVRRNARLVRVSRRVRVLLEVAKCRFRYVPEVLLQDIQRRPNLYAVAFPVHEPTLSYESRCEAYPMIGACRGHRCADLTPQLPPREHRLGEHLHGGDIGRALESADEVDHLVRWARGATPRAQGNARSVVAELHPGRL